MILIIVDTEDEKSAVEAVFIKARGFPGRYDYTIELAKPDDPVSVGVDIGQYQGRHQHRS
jgi:hypothetical protein